MSTLGWILCIAGVIGGLVILFFLYSMLKSASDADDYSEIAFQAYLDENNITSGCPVDLRK